MTASHGGFSDLLPSIHLPSLVVTSTHFILAGNGPPLSLPVQLLGFQGSPRIRSFTWGQGRHPPTGAQDFLHGPLSRPPHTFPTATQALVCTTPSSPKPRQLLGIGGADALELETGLLLLHDYKCIYAQFFVLQN